MTESAFDSKPSDSRSLARNAALNLIGQAAPLAAALVAIPILLSALGTERFGILTLAWLVIGYLGLFDLGLGRALTKLVAEKLAAGARAEIPALVATALAAMAGLGVAVALLLGLVNPWLVDAGLHVSGALQQETVAAFHLLALSVPFVVATTGLRGVLEAYQRFGVVNLIRIPVGLLTFLAPVLVLPVASGLPAIVTALLVVRMLALLAHLVACRPLLRDVDPSAGSRTGTIGELLAFGGWITVSNVVGPLMIYLDRFLIGTLISVTAVAYYATPYEVVTKVLLIPGALAGVLFPAFAATLTHHPARARFLYGSGTKFVFLAVFPLVLLCVTLAEEGLALWLGNEFARHSAVALQLLAVGVLLNSIAQVPFAVIQGAGRADISAKLHLAELPLYLLGVWWLIQWYGIAGAALAWAIRAAIDCVMLFALAARHFPAAGGPVRVPSILTLFAVAALAAGAWLSASGVKLVFVAVTLAMFGLYAWRVVLTPGEKAFARHPLRTALDRN